MIEAAVKKLHGIQQALLDTLATVDDKDCRRQFHHDISPIGWHLMHTVFTENLWLREHILNDGTLNGDWHRWYVPANIAKSERGRSLPELKKIIEMVSTLQAKNRKLLSQGEKRLLEHPLMKEAYLVYFLIQHHAMHLETIRLALVQKHISNQKDHRLQNILRACAPQKQCLEVIAGHYDIGSNDKVICFDNEHTRHQQNLQTFSIGKKPVSNAEYLGFIENHGYQNRSWWSETGWRWCEQNQVQAPDHWRQNGHGHWYGHDQNGICDLPADAAVYGLSWHEACAYARYAGGRLPHEYEWEAACSCAAMDGVGQVWEWCLNTFKPYPGFRAFPYKAYSSPWFDGQHYVLRGACRYSADVLHRISLRNFHYAWKQHICAGLRVAYDDRKTAENKTQ